MRGQHNSVPLLVQRPNELPQRLAQFDINTRCRFVEDDHRGAMDERLRNQHASLHPTGERSHIGIGFVRQAQTLEDFIDPGIVMTQAVITGLQAQNFANGEKRIEHQFLRYDPQCSPCSAKIAFNIVSHDRGPTGTCTDEPGNDRNQRGFARAVRSQQSKKLAGFNPKRNPVERSELPIALDQTRDFDRGNPRVGRHRSNSRIQEQAVGAIQRSQFEQFLRQIDQFEFDTRALGATQRCQQHHHRR